LFEPEVGLWASLQRFRNIHPEIANGAHFFLYLYLCVSKEKDIRGGGLEKPPFLNGVSLDSVDNLGNGD